MCTFSLLHNHCSTPPNLHEQHTPVKYCTSAITRTFIITDAFILLPSTTLGQCEPFMHDTITHVIIYSLIYILNQWFDWSGTVYALIILQELECFNGGFSLRTFTTMRKNLLFQGYIHSYIKDNSSLFSSISQLIIFSILRKVWPKGMVQPNCPHCDKRRMKKVHNQVQFCFRKSLHTSKCFFASSGSVRLYITTGQGNVLVRVRFLASLLGLLVPALLDPSPPPPPLTLFTTPPSTPATVPILSCIPPKDKPA